MNDGELNTTSFGAQRKQRGSTDKIILYLHRQKRGALPIILIAENNVRSLDVIPLSASGKG